MHKIKLWTVSLFSALALTTGVYAQNMSDIKSDTLPIPKIPDFEINYEPDVHARFTNTSGSVFWKAHTYEDEKSHSEITELRGQVDISVKLWFIPAKSIYTGFITRIDRKNQTIETISYTKGDDHSHLSNYLGALAAKEGIDTTKSRSIDHRLSDYKNGRAYNLELMADSSTYCLPEADTTLPSGAIGFQEAYFMIPRSQKDTILTIFYKGQSYLVETKTYTDDDYPIIFSDLTKPDPEHPDKRIQMLEDLYWIRLSIDKDGIPKNVVGKAPGTFGDVDVELKRK